MLPPIRPAISVFLFHLRTEPAEPLPSPPLAFRLGLPVSQAVPPPEPAARLAGDRHVGRPCRSLIHGFWVRHAPSDGRHDGTDGETLL